MLRIKPFTLGCMVIYSVGAWCVQADSRDGIAGVVATPALQLPSEWQLQGVFSASDGSGTALLRLNESTQISLQAGDQLPGGVVVLALKADRVVLQRGASRAELMLRGAASTASVQTLAAPPAAATNDGLPSCQAYVDSGVPLDELISVGVCTP